VKRGGQLVHLRRASKSSIVMHGKSVRFTARISAAMSS